jgi:hypothetical protein
MWTFCTCITYTLEQTSQSNICVGQFNHQNYLGTRCKPNSLSVPRYPTSHDDRCARAAVWAYRLLSDWTGTPPVGWSGRRLPSGWMGHIKCRVGTSPVCRADRRRAISAINAEIAWPWGLTSDSTRRLTSRVVGQVAAPGPRLSGERRRAWQDPDKCLCRTHVRTWLRSGYSSSRDLVVDDPDLT